MNRVPPAGYDGWRRCLRRGGLLPSGRTRSQTRTISSLPAAAIQALCGSATITVARPIYPLAAGCVLAVEVLVSGPGGAVCEIVGSLCSVKDWDLSLRAG
jgi:hypothetical protein